MIAAMMLLFFVSCSRLYVSRSETAKTVIVVDSVHGGIEDSVSLAIIAPYKERVDSLMNQVLGYSEQNMVKSQPCGLLNNFVADVVLEKGNEYLLKQYQKKADISLLNSGGLRSVIPKGEVTLRNVYELMPFENELLALEISGTKTLDMLEFIAEKGGMPESGIIMGISSDSISKVSIQNKNFDPARSYIVITSDYLAYGGDDMGFFSKPLNTYILNVRVRDAIAEYMKEQTAAGKTLKAADDKRIYYE